LADRRPRRYVLRHVDNVLRPAPNLVVNAADVLAHDADARHLHAAQERDEDDDRRDTKRVILAAHELVEHDDERIGEGCDANHYARVEQDRQWLGGETEHAVERDFQRAEKAIVLAATVRALVSVVLDFLLAKADEGDETAQETMRFGELPQLF